MYPDSNLRLNYETDDAIYFFITSFMPLDNWSPHRVKIWNRTFSTVDHAYHFRKYDETAPEIAA